MKTIIEIALFILVIAASGCSSTDSTGKNLQVMYENVSNSKILNSTNVVIKNILKQGVIVVGKDLTTSDVTDSLDLTVPIDEFLNPAAAIANGDPIHIKIPKSLAASETVKVTTFQYLNASNLTISNSSGIDIGNDLDSGGIQSTGTIIAQISAQLFQGGTNTSVSGLALPSKNIYSDKTNALQQTSSTVLKANVIDPQTGTNTPAYIPIPNKLISTSKP